MARQDKKTYELTEAEQRDLVTLIQRGGPCRRGAASFCLRRSGKYQQ
jgi:hypothetical protein